MLRHACRICPNIRRACGKLAVRAKFSTIAFCLSAGRTRGFPTCSCYDKIRTMVKAIGWIIFLLLALVVVWSVGRAIPIASLRYPAVPPFSVPQFTVPAVISEQPSTMAPATIPPETQQPAEEKQGAQEDISSLRGFVHLIRSSVSATDPGREYIEIHVDGNAPAAIPLSGWTLENSQHTRVSIGKGVDIFFPPPTLNIPQDIVLAPGMKAIIATGQSPKGVSFRLNACAGYMSQTSGAFAPPLPSRSCPQLTGNLEPQTFLNNTCLDYIDTVPRCAAPTLPGSLSPECRTYITAHASYNSCFSTYRNTPDFLGTEWRIFLQRSQELWGERNEIIILRDHTGRVVDALAY